MHSKRLIFIAMCFAVRIHSMECGDAGERKSLIDPSQGSNPTAPVQVPDCRTAWRQNTPCARATMVAAVVIGVSAAVYFIGAGCRRMTTGQK